MLQDSKLMVHPSAESTKKEEKHELELSSKVLEKEVELDFKASARFKATNVEASRHQRLCLVY